MYGNYGNRGRRNMGVASGAHPPGVPGRTRSRRPPTDSPAPGQGSGRGHTMKQAKRRAQHKAMRRMRGRGGMRY